MKLLILISSLVVLAFCAEPECQNCVLMAKEIDRIIVTNPTGIGGKFSIDRFVPNNIFIFNYQRSNLISLDSWQLCSYRTFHLKLVIILLRWKVIISHVLADVIQSIIPFTKNAKINYLQTSTLFHLNFVTFNLYNIMLFYNSMSS